MRPDPQEISLAFLTHLEREEAVLLDTLDLLRRVRAALLRSDAAELQALRAPQELAAAATDRLRAERDALRVRLGQVIGQEPAGVSLTTLTAALPADLRRPIVGAGDRLRALAKEADRLVRANANLASYLVRFTRGVLLNLTGGETRTCYGPSGTHLEASFGSLLSTQG